MKKLLRAVAAVMLLATGAQAAITGPYVEAVVGAPGNFNFWTGPTIYPTLDGTFQSYTLDLFVRTDTEDVKVQNFLWSGDPASVPFGFSWAGGVASELSMRAELTFYNTTIKDSVGGTWFTGVSGMGPYTRTHQQTILLDANANRLAAETNPTPVPIGGTLPLMLSALGLGAMVMRRRAKRAALA